MGDGDFDPVVSHARVHRKPDVLTPHQTFVPAIAPTSVDANASQEGTVESSQARTSWSRFQRHWLFFAQAAKSQWPDIGFEDLLTAGRSRAFLCDLVARTYGLDERAADRAVAVWQCRVVDQDDTLADRTETTAA